MKALARSHVWWSGLNRDLETLARSCSSCAAVKQSPDKVPVHPWTWPTRPWERVHLDFASPFLNKSFLIATDSHSKWAEVVEMSRMQKPSLRSDTYLPHMAYRKHLSQTTARNLRQRSLQSLPSGTELNTFYLPIPP